MTPDSDSMRATARRLLRYARAERAKLLLAVGCFLLGSAIEPVVPWLFKTMLDKGFAASAFPLWLVPLVVIGLFLVRGVFSFGGSYLMASGSSSVVMALRRDLMRSLLNAEASLYVNLSPAVAVAKVIGDPVGSFGALTSALTTLLRDGTSLIFLLGYLVYLNWQLTLISMAVLPGMVYLVRKLHVRLRRVGRVEYQTQQQLAAMTDEAVRGWRVVRTFNAEDFELERFGTESRRLRGLTIKRTAAGSMMTPLTQTVSAVGVSIILVLALWQARHGQATVGEFVSFITALLMTISPLRHLTDLSQPIVNSLVVAQGCFQLLDVPREAETGTRELPAVAGDIRFEDVSVRYHPDEAPALDHLNLHVPAGATVALVGPSGSGKTTTVSALLRFVPMASGRILLDGIDTADVARRSLRRHFAVVSQDIVLFDGSIAANVAYAQPQDPQRVETALRHANLWDFVQSLPEGVNTLVGSNGSRLSGGQRQRLAIARALYKESSIWIFDEATSALDSESEQVVQQSLETWGGRKTMILIAHRLSTVRHADRIYVLGDGRVLETGSHAELMASGGLYAAMVATQSGTPKEPDEAVQAQPG